MERKMVTLIEEINPDYYKEFIYIDIRRKECMYAEGNKGIYGTLEASLLLWEKLSKRLEEMGYQRNKYDWCVMNKIVNDKQ